MSGTTDTPTYDQDYETLDEFWTKVHDGEEVSPSEVSDAHAAWWRLAEAEKVREGGPKLSTFIMLGYTLKYLPGTPLDDADV